MLQYGTMLPETTSCYRLALAETLEGFPATLRFNPETKQSVSLSHVRPRLVKDAQYSKILQLCNWRSRVGIRRLSGFSMAA